MLPPLYDEDAASKSLDTVAQSRSQKMFEQTGMFAQLMDADLSLYTIGMYQEPKSWRLSTRNDTGSLEPILMRIQGILVDCTLPPIAKPSSPAGASRIRQYIRQGVAFSGLYSSSFKRVIEQIEMIQLMMSNAHAPGAMEDWQPSFTGDHKVVSAHNRYFLRKSLAPNQERIPFDAAVDPQGYLDDMQDAAFIHTHENRVEYYAQFPDSNGRIMTTSPTIFRPGDIVELTVEFCAFPSASKIIPVLQLKALRMLFPDHRNTALILKMRERTANTVVHNRVPKRKAMYEQEDIEEMGRKLQKMSVSDIHVDP